MTDAERLDFYRDAYEKTLKRAEALEKTNTQLYEREALHTEEVGMLRQEIERLNARLSHSATWIPVGERLPDEEGRFAILYLHPATGIVRAFIADYYPAMGGWAGMVDDTEVTHWMPLPEAPK